MTPWISKSGHRRFQRTIAGVHITNSSGVRYPKGIGARARRELDKEFDRREAILFELKAHGQIDVLRLFARGRVTIEQLVDAKRRGRLSDGGLLADMELNRPLWDAIETTLPRMGKRSGKGTSQERYRTSFTKLKRLSGTVNLAELGPQATVADLQRVRWAKLSTRWVGSGSDWNHLRKAVGAFLTVLLGDVHHPFRRAVMATKHFPKQPEVEREPDLTPEVFWNIVAATPEHAQPCYVTLAVTGMRLGEYLRCTVAHLRPATHGIAVPGTKTEESAATITVDEDFWPWIVVGVPAPLKQKWMREHWHRACVALGVATQAEGERYVGPTLHDLRHFYAQTASDAGASTAQIQKALRHADPQMTRRYESRRDRGEVARMVGKALNRERVG